MKSPILLGAVLCGVFTRLVPTATAATKTWTGGSSAQWSAPGNWLNAGILELDRFSFTLPRVAVPGDLIVGDGSSARLLFANQIANTAAVTVNDSGMLDLNDNSDTIGALTMNGGQVDTGTGTLTLNGDITATTTVQNSFIFGQLALGSATRAFTVNFGLLFVNAVVSGTGGITKAGVGTLALGAPNTYSGLNGTTPGSGHDQLDARGTVSLSSCTLNVTVGGGFVPVIGQIFTLLNNDGTDPIPTGSAGLSEGAPVPAGAYEFMISYVGGSGNDITLTMTHVPEPLRIVDILVDGGNLTVTFQSIPGQTYHVEKTARLAPSNWQDISGPLIATGATTIFTTPAPDGAANCFFQIVSP